MSADNENYLRAWRKARGMTLQQAGEAAGHDKSQLSKLERDSRRVSRGWLLKLAKVYGCRPADLMAPPPEARPSSDLSGEPIAPEFVAAATEAFHDALLEAGIKITEITGAEYARAVLLLATEARRAAGGGVDIADLGRIAQVIVRSRRPISSSTPQAKMIESARLGGRE